MTELRRRLLDPDVDAPTDLPEDLQLLAARQAAAAALLIDHAELYKLLYRRLTTDGPSEELHAIALDAAGNLSAVLGALRSREDLLQALAAAHPETVPVPTLLIDQLVDSLVLLSAPCDEDELAMCLTPQRVDDLLAQNAVQEWLADLHADEVFDGPLTSRFGLDSQA